MQTCSNNNRVGIKSLKLLTDSSASKSPTEAQAKTTNFFAHHVLKYAAVISWKNSGLFTAGNNKKKVKLLHLWLK